MTENDFGSWLLAFELGRIKTTEPLALVEL